ncbi:MAG: hypothetical protein FJ265_02465 [Planctomycetes bacterium]|nr:hypothetical protein [Planctomycetota bacterium]
MRSHHAFVLSLAGAAGGLFAQQGPLPADAAPASTQLALKYATFDPRLGLPPVPAALASAEDVHLFVVQFRGAPTDAGRDALRGLGAELLGYLPHDAYVVRMTHGTAGATAALPAVRFVGAYEPAWRLEAELVNAIAAGIYLPPHKYNVVAADKRRDKPALAQAIAALGGKVVDPQQGGLLMVVELDGPQLARAARLDQVLWIDRWSAPELDMDNARIQGGANYVETAGGWTGQGVRGHVYEGVEATHQDFTTPFTNVLSNGIADTHGHCTAGIVFGNGTSIAGARGMAPNARGFFTEYSSASGSRNSVIGTVVGTHQAMFTTASWGGARTRQYTSISADTDDIIFDHRIPWTQSQSNAGNPDSRPEAWAKNIFSIGGVQHYDNSNPLDDSWAGGGGSTGPAADGRIKPDLCAYYDAILCSDLTGSAGYSTGNYYTSFGGTSGATPICAGHNAIAIQLYTDAIFGNPLPLPPTLANRFANRPLAQTLKALQIVSAQQYAFTAASTDNRREHCGWGFPSLRNMYDGRNRTYIVPETDVLTQGLGRTHYVTVGTGVPELKICMTFVDPAGNPAASLARINDLTLRVVSPAGTVYWGNNGLTAGNYSTPGGSPNTVDTVENVFVQNPAAGVWTVDVIASLVAQDAHLATTQVDATYALCCVGGTGTIGGTGSYATSSSYGTGCAAASVPQVGRTFYEVFGTFDLANNAFRFTPNGSGGWNVSTCATCFDTRYATNLVLGDDQMSRNRALGFAFPLAGGGSTTAIDVDSNGWIGLVANAHAGTDYTETVSEFLANPARIAAMWDDLNPGAAGAVYFDALPGVALVTWLNVPEYSSTGSNTAQIQLFPNGEFVLAYRACSVADCLVGYSVGGGQPDPGPSDITNPSGGPVLTLSPSGPPRFGATVTLTATNYPANSGLGVQVVSLVRHDPGIDLTSYGMPGCWQYTGFEAMVVVIPAGGQSAYGLGIPNSTTFSGLQLTAQTYAFSPGANTAGVISSNGVALTVGL